MTWGPLQYGVIRGWGTREWCCDYYFFIVITFRSWQVVWGKSVATALYHKKYMLFYPIISPLKKHAGYFLYGAGVDYICDKDISNFTPPAKISVRTETLSCIGIS